MAQDLGKRDTVGTAAPAIDNSGLNPFGNGFWVARFDPNALPRIPFEIYRMAVKGPAGCSLQVYVDTAFATGTPLGSLNQFSAQNDEIKVQSGQSIILYWNTAAAPAPSASLYFRAQ